MRPKVFCRANYFFPPPLPRGGNCPPDTPCLGGGSPPLTPPKQGGNPPATTEKERESISHSGQKSSPLRYEQKPESVAAKPLLTSARTPSPTEARQSKAKCHPLLSDGLTP